MDGRYGSSGREPTLQVQSPEFKLQSHPKQNKTKQYYRAISYAICFDHPPLLLVLILLPLFVAFFVIS
jgi:hypothetical protein